MFPSASRSVGGGALGPNGAGRSTSIDVLLGLTRADRGSAWVLGRTPRQAVEALIGAMLQVGALIHDVSVRELAHRWRRCTPDPLGIEEVLELVDLDDIADRRTQKRAGRRSG